MCIVLQWESEKFKIKKTKTIKIWLKKLINKKGCDTVLVPRGSTCPTPRKHECPGESHSMRTLCAEPLMIKCWDGKKVCKNKAAIKQQDKNGCVHQHPKPIRGAGLCSC